MGQAPDQLRHEIDDKREDAVVKLNEIEARVQNTTQRARDTVDETMQAAKETVSATVSETMDTATETVETVKQNFDLNKQAQERPLMMVGLAALGGFILDGAIGGKKHHRSERSHQGSQREPSPVQQAVHKTGLDTTMSAVTGTIVGMAADRLRGIIDENFPEFGQRLRQEMDSGSRSSPNYRPGSYRAGGHTEGGEIPPRPEGAYREPLQ